MTTTDTLRDPGEIAREIAGLDEVADIEQVIIAVIRARDAAAGMEAAKANRETVAAWMIAHSFAAGHGDTLSDLLGELTWQVEELRNARQEAEAAGFRRGIEAAARVAADDASESEALLRTAPDQELRRAWRAAKLTASTLSATIRALAPPAAPADEGRSYLTEQMAPRVDAITKEEGK